MYILGGVGGDSFIIEKAVQSDNSFRRMLFDAEAGGDVCELRELSEPDYIDELVKYSGVTSCHVTSCHVVRRHVRRCDVMWSVVIFSLPQDSCFHLSHDRCCCLQVAISISRLQNSPQIKADDCSPLSGSDIQPSFEICNDDNNPLNGSLLSPISLTPKRVYSCYLVDMILDKG